jgi:hypothetical protein
MQPLSIYIDYTNYFVRENKQSRIMNLNYSNIAEKHPKKLPELHVIEWYN